jgi:hypothetical protein
LVSHIKTKTKIEGIQEQDTQEHIWVKREVVMEQWRKLHNEKLHHLYSTPITDQIMDEMTVTYDVREKKNTYTVLVGRPEERGHLEDTGVDWRMTLKWILNRMEGMWFRTGGNARLVDMVMILRIP